MKYDVAVRRFVLRLVNVKHQPIDHVVEFTGISKNTIKRWIKNGVHDPPQKRTKITLKDQATPLILEMLATTCVWTHAKMCESLATQGVHCSKRTLFTILTHLKITRKRIKKKKCSKNTTPESLAAFKSEWIRITEDGQDIIFQDESHFSNNILPLYGYSKRNTPCYINEPSERSSHTLNLAFSKSGQIFWKIYKGSCNTARMQWFVDHLPPVRVLMDNHSIHKAVHMTTEKIFTPVAQPDANPVEIIFSKVKDSFRTINEQNRELDVETKIEMALGTLIYDDLVHAIEFVDQFIRSTY